MMRGTDMIVSSRVVEAVEALDPGRHQFIEQQIDNEPQALRRRGLTFYLLNCCLYLDCIDREISKLVNIFADNPKLRPSYAEAPNHELYAHVGWRPPAHLWRDKQWLKHNHFISAELRERLDAIDAGPIGYRPVHLI